MKLAALFLLVVLMAISVAVPKDKRAPRRIELLMFDGCPNSPIMKANLLAAMHALHITTRPTVVDILKLPAGDVRKGYGAPSVLVNGKDLFGHKKPKPSEALPSCRLYHGGVPTAAEIEKRLGKA